MAQQIVALTEKESGATVRIGADQIIKLYAKDSDNKMAYESNGLTKEITFTETLSAISTEAGNTIEINIDGVGFYINADRVSALIEGNVPADDYMMYDNNGASLEKINMDETASAIEIAIDAL